MKVMVHRVSVRASLRVLSVAPYPQGTGGVDRTRGSAYGGAKRVPVVLEELQPRFSGFKAPVPDLVKESKSATRGRPFVCS